jgi:hypothetical protein
VEPDDSDDPLQSGALSVKGVVVQTAHLSHVIQEFGWWFSRRGRPIILSWWYPEIPDNRHQAKLPENPINITLSGQNGKLING